MSSQPFAEELVALLPRLRRFALSLAGHPAEADDLVQAACERALKAQDQWEPGTRLDAWVFRILRNLWIDRIRKRKSDGPTEDIDESFDMIGDDGRQVTELALTMERVQAGLAGLPEDQRRVLTLVCVEEMTYREAADTLAVPIGTVMSRLARARRALGTAMGLGEGESPLAVLELGRP